MSALVIGGSLVYYFSRRNVQPIIELGQELQTAVEVQKNLQEVVDSQRPIICTSYVRQLLSGTATSEDEVAYMETIWESLLLLIIMCYILCTIITLAIM